MAPHVGDDGIERMTSDEVRAQASALLAESRSEVDVVPHDHFASQIGDIKEVGLSTEPTRDEMAAEAVERARQAFLRICQGVGPEAPKTTNAAGGKQSMKRWRFDLYDAGAMYVLGRVLDRGAREYGIDNWRLIETNSHLNACLMHILAFMGGDRSDDHLGHLMCRSMFALGVELANNPEYDYRQGDER